MIPIFIGHVLYQLANPPFVDLSDTQRIYENLNTFLVIVCIRKIIEK
jgi:hypothetical protein